MAELSLTANGRISARGFSYPELLTLFSRCFKFNEEMYPGKLDTILQRAIKNAIQTGSRDPNDFVDFCKKLERDLKSADSIRFSLYSDLNLIGDVKGSLRIKIDETLLYLGTTPPFWAKNCPRQHFASNSIYDSPECRSYIWSHCTAASNYEAGEKSIKSFELLSALVNFQFRFRSSIPLFPMPLADDNAFEHGPNYYLYNRDDQSWSDRFWMSNHYNKRQWDARRIKFSDLRKSIPFVRKHFVDLNNSPHSKRLRSSLIALNDYWIHGDPTIRIPALWRAVECLFSSRNGRVDQSNLVRRAVQGMRDPEKWLMEQRLYLLADVRNDTVHAFSSIARSNSPDRWVKVVEFWLLENYARLLSLDRRIFSQEEDYLQLLELPSSAQKIRQKIKVMRSSLAMLEYESQPQSGIASSA